MITEIFYFSWTKIYLPFQFFQQRRKVKFRTFDNMVYYGVRLFKKSQWAWSKINAVTVLNMYEVYTSTGCPKLGLRVCQQWEKSAVQIYAAVGSSKKNRQRRLLTNIGLTMECPSQAGKLIKGIGWRELGLSKNSAAKTLAACTQMRIRQRTAACVSQGLDLTWSKTWTKDCPRHTSDSTADEARADR